MKHLVFLFVILLSISFFSLSAQESAVTRSLTDKEKAELVSVCKQKKGRLLKRIANLKAKLRGEKALYDIEEDEYSLKTFTKCVEEIEEIENGKNAPLSCDEIESYQERLKSVSNSLETLSKSYEYESETNQEEFTQLCSRVEKLKKEVNQLRTLWELEGTNVIFTNGTKVTTVKLLLQGISFLRARSGDNYSDVFRLK